MENKSGKIFDKTFFVALIVGVAIAGSFLLGFYSNEWLTDPTLRELEFILKIIEENYTGEFDKDKFIASAISGTLDRYSTYYTVPEYEEVTLVKDGVTQGKTGITLNSSLENCYIYSVGGNSPAERAGIVEGGIITGAKKTETEDYSEINNVSDFNAFLSNVDKEIFYLRISYDNGDEFFSLKRENYSESYVWYQDSTGAYNLTGSGNDWSLTQRQKPLKSHVNEGYAYVKYSSFNGLSFYQLESALDKMKENGNTKLILDLRSNGGGYMDILEKVCSLLCPGSGRETISKAIYKSGETQSFYATLGRYDDYNFDSIAVLCNTGSASASEALIGAMLDYDAKSGKNIVKVYVSESSYGYRTYGKGIMQTTFRYETGSAIKLTTAKIYWPVSNVCIHGDGVTPELDNRVIGVPYIEGKDAEFLTAMI